MPEMVSLVVITRNSLRDFWKHKSLWWFAVPVGTLVGFNTVVSQAIQNHIPKNPELSPLSVLLSDYRLVLIFSGSLLVILCQSAIRGALITTFVHQGRKFNGSSPATVDKNSFWHDMIRASWISVSLEGIYWLLLLGIGAAVIMPVFLAQYFNPSVTAVIFELGSLLLLIIGVYFYLIKELSCFYAILGKTGFRSASDLGFRPFRKNTFSTLLFFLYAALLSLIFSLFIENLFGLSSLPIEQYPSFPSLLSGILFGLYYIFDQILKTSFFRSIANTKKKYAVEEAFLEASKTPSGISPN